MTSEAKNGNGKWARRIRDELLAEAAQRPARIELERRRLLARVGTGKSAILGLNYLPGFAIGACALATVILLVLFVPNWDDGAASTITVSGLWKVSEKDPLARGHKMIVPADTGAKVVLEDGTTLWLGSTSEVSAEDPAFKEVKLDKGRVLASVAKREAPENFRLKTPSGNVLVHGTVFSVDIDENGSWIRLYEGEIELEVGDNTIDVSPGHQVRISKGVVLSMTRIDRAAVIADLMITEKTAGLDGPPVPQISVPDEEQNEPEVSIEQPIILPVQGENREKKKPKSKRVKPPKRGIVSSGDPIIEDTDTMKINKPELIDPELEAIEVETGEDVSPDEDELFDQAYLELKAGHHKEAREILEEYVEVYPKARYWEHVKNILGD